MDYVTCNGVSESDSVSIWSENGLPALSSVTLTGLITTGVQPGKILRWKAFVGSGRGPLAYMKKAAGAMRKMIDCPIPLTERNSPLFQEVVGPGPLFWETGVN